MWRESDVEGERDTAKRKIERIAADLGKTFKELVSLIEDYMRVQGQWTKSGPCGQSGQSSANSGANPPPLSLTEILAFVRGILLRYLVLPNDADLIVALWIASTFVFRKFMHCPRLVLDSVDPGHGKTTLLDVLAQTCNKGERIDDLTAAFIYAHLEAHNGNATILMDEGQNYDFRDERGLVRIYNSGHRRGGSVARNIQGERVKYGVFAPLAAAAVDARGTFAPDMLQRAIIISMPLATRAQARSLRRFDLEDQDTHVEFAAVRNALSLWAREASRHLDTDPEMPDGLHNRVADNFRPLIAIADAACPEAGEQARRVAVDMAKAYVGVGVRLLKDIRHVRDAFGGAHISSVALIKQLVAREGSEWGQCRGERNDRPPRELNPAILGDLLRSPGLRRFSLGARTVRWGSNPSDTYQGFQWAWFEEAWRELGIGDGNQHDDGGKQPARRSVARVRLLRGGRRD